MLRAGNKAPDFALVGADGKRTTLAVLLEKGPVTLVFFKVGCPTCQLTMPFMSRLTTEAGERANIVAISQDDAKNTARFERSYGVEMPMLHDSAKERYPASNAYQIESVPTFFTVKEDGTIEHSFAGFVRSELEDFGKRLGVETFRANETVPAMKPG